MKILICAGKMPYAVPTVRFGGLIARLTKSSVIVLTVVGSQAEQVAGEETLAQAREMLGELTVETKTRRGAPAEEILAETEEGDYDLVVVGARDVIGLTELLLGSVARHVVNHALASVLVVKRGRPNLERLLICTGGREIAEPVIRMGARLAQAAAARATLLYVVSPVPSMYTGLKALEETLSELLQTDTPAARHLRHGAEILDQYGVKAELELRHGVVADEILREAHQGDYDLIVIGTGVGGNRLKGLLMEDVTGHIVDHALRPVLVVQPQG
ncbi:MAG: universal stress protein [Anaerolineae bacterium]